MPERSHGTSSEELSAFRYPIATGPTDEVLLKALTDDLPFPIDDPRLNDTEAAQVIGGYYILATGKEIAERHKKHGALEGGAKAHDHRPSTQRTIESVSDGLSVSNIMNIGEKLGEFASRKSKLIPAIIHRGVALTTGDYTRRGILISLLAERYGADEEHPFATSALGPFIAGLAVQIAAERDFALLSERTANLFLNEWRANKGHAKIYPRALHILARDLGAARGFTAFDFVFTTAPLKRNPARATEVNETVIREQRLEHVHNVARAHITNMEAKRREIVSDMRTGPIELAQEPLLPPTVDEKHERTTPPGRRHYNGYRDVSLEKSDRLLRIAMDAYDQQDIITLLYAATALLEQRAAKIQQHPRVGRDFAPYWERIQAGLLPAVGSRIEAIKQGRALAVEAVFIRHMTETPTNSSSVRRLRKAFMQGALTHFGMPPGNYQASIARTLGAAYTYNTLVPNTTWVSEGGTSTEAIRLQDARRKDLLDAYQQVPPSHRYVLRNNQAVSQLIRHAQAGGGRRSMFNKE